MTHLLVAEAVLAGMTERRRKREEDAAAWSAAFEASDAAHAEAIGGTV